MSPLADRSYTSVDGRYLAYLCNSTDILASMLVGEYMDFYLDHHPRAVTRRVRASGDVPV
jgi:hypothetical protein